MGLLDDAIREHLELKRRHGADPGELAKLEREAFGPIQRGDAAGVVAEQERPAEPVYEAEPEPEPAYEPEPAAGSARWEPEAEVPQTPPAPVEQPVVEPAYEPAEPAPVVEPEPAPAVVPEPEPAPELPADPADEQHTVAFTLEDEPEVAAPPADVVPGDPGTGEHDELEETPEFLQEAPEHDRLWFEQKPPRDFDF